MDTIKLSVAERQETGNGPARRLRAEGRIPGVTYGKDKDPTAISVALEDLRAAMTHGHNVGLELDFGKRTRKSKSAKAETTEEEKTTAKGDKGARYAVVKQLQFHPTKRQLLHVDLHEVDLNVEIESPVAIEAVGTAAGLADGGILDWDRREVTVRALPRDMPGSLELDVSELLIGHHLTVAALSAPEGVTIVDDPEAVLLAMVPPRVEVAEEEEAEEEGLEPALVGEEGEEREEAQREETAAE